MKFKAVLSSLATACVLTAPAMAGAPTAPSNAAAQANNEFGWSLFDELRESQLRTENMLFSPLSAFLALSLVSNGTEQETLEEIQNILHTDEYTLVQTNPLVRDLVQTLVSNQDSTETLRIANAVWVNSDSFDLAEKFQADATTFYSIIPDEDVVTSASFQDESTVQQINAWVSRNTGGMIPTIVDQLEPEMAAILLNALYFQGQWLQQFSSNLTGNESFQLSDGSTKTVSMMHESALTLPFASSDSYKMITLAFRKGENVNGEALMGRFKLDLVLPVAEEGDIFAIQATDYQYLLERMELKVARVAIPKFKFSFEETLNDSLKAMGMERAFQPGLAQMESLGTPKLGGRAFISKVLQKTAVEMDENGFKAAAVTSVTVETTTAPAEQETFVADRPFFFALRDQLTGTLLFQGIVANPEF